MSQPHLIVQIDTRHCLPHTLKFYRSGETAPFRVVTAEEYCPALQSMITQLGDPSRVPATITMTEQATELSETLIRLRLQQHWFTKNTGDLEKSWMICAMDFVMRCTTNARDEMSLLVA